MKINLKKINWWVVAILFIAAFAIFYLFYPVVRTELLKETVNPQETANIQPVIDNDNCYGYDLYLDEASEKLKNNQTAINILKECYWLMDVVFGDFNGDKEEELAMIVSGVGCVSCNGNDLYIIKNDKVIFEKSGEDLIIKPLKDNSGFMLKEPIRKNEEALCCPSEGTVLTYKFDKEKNEFIIMGEPRIEAYRHEGSTWYGDILE